MIPYSDENHLNFYFSSQVTCKTIKDMNKRRWHTSAEPCNEDDRDTHRYCCKAKQYKFSFQKMSWPLEYEDTYIQYQKGSTYTSFEGVPFDEFNFCFWRKKRVRNKLQLIALLKTNNGISSARGRMLMKILNLWRLATIVNKLPALLF